MMSASQDMPKQRRAFAAVQAAKAGIGAVLGLVYVMAVGRPDGFEALAIAGLVAPGVLALMVFTPLSQAALELAGLGLFALVIGLLAALTGGVESPLMLWLLLVPAEAALTGARGAVMRAALAAGAVLALVAALGALALLPPSRLGGAGFALTAISLAGALLQAALLAVAAQSRQAGADAAAAQGTAMYRFLADNAMDLITRHGADGRIRYASPASLGLLGCRPRELVGAAPTALVHPDDLAVVQAAFVEASYFGRPASAEVRLRRKDGDHVWAEMRCRPAGADGAPGAGADIVAVTRDIGERKAQERALTEARDAALDASRAKSRFLANMSHELRTPLNAIIGFSEVMAREMFGALGNARYQEYSRLIHESGSHLLDLINGVLDMSKIEAGKFALHEELFDLEETAQSALRFVRIPADRAGVVLKLAVSAAARQAFADRRAVKQILINLLSNGIKYTPPGGEVRLGAETESGGLTLTVTDTGTGIAPDDLKRLGQPFEQVESAQTRAKEGTGLGLALVKALAALHGGEALLASVLGEGTSVTVRLPHAAVTPDGKSLRGAKVLPFRGAA
jgi:cell cycle sensor histidine kinase DivJ